MPEMITDIFSAYLQIGYVVTGYVALMFLFTGHHIFNSRLMISGNHKAGYVIAMFIILPVFYPFFIREILSLHQQKYTCDPVKLPSVKK